MPADTEAAARLRAYELMQVVQSAARESAVRDLVALEAHARRCGWREAELVAAAGLTMSVLLRPDADQAAAATDALVARARSVGAPHLLALALSLRAVAAAGRDDGEALLADAASALAIVEEDSLPALDRCAVLLICAAGYNTLRLWELVTELLDRASALAPLCERPVQEPAVAANRVLVRLEWAVSLLETGATRGRLGPAGARRRRGDLRRWRTRACSRCGATTCSPAVTWWPSSWRRRTSTEEAADQLAVLDAHAATLAADGDVEVLPTLQALVPYALLCRGRAAEALARVRRDVPASTTTGAASFPLWVRAEVLAGQGRPDRAADDAVVAFRDYADAVSRHRWTMRQGLLEAARGRIASASLSIENLALARDLMLDPLTGIANRRAFDAWLTAVHPVETAAALLLLDLDQFKQINDVHGHAVGDDVLRAVSRLLVAHVRPGDLALRLGGDELAVVVQHPPVDAATSRSLDLAHAGRDRGRAGGGAVDGRRGHRLGPGRARAPGADQRRGRRRLPRAAGVRCGRPALPRRRRRAVRRQVLAHPQRRLTRPHRSSVRVHTSATRPAYSSGVAPAAGDEQVVLRAVHRPHQVGDVVVGEVVAELAGGPQVGGEQPHVARAALVRAPPAPRGSPGRSGAATRSASRDRDGAGEQPAERRGVRRDLGPGRRRPRGPPGRSRAARPAPAPPPPSTDVVHREQQLRLAADAGVDGVDRDPRAPGDLRRRPCRRSPRSANRSRRRPAGSRRRVALGADAAGVVAS